MTSPAARRPYDRVKRVIDVVAAAIGLALTAPLQAVIAGLVARNLGRPVLFRQQRPGLGGKPFTLVKFRTMRDVDPERGLVSDADRLTPFGRTLRSTSLDELPSLWNVLRGDMSLVGPRPLLMRYMPYFTEREKARFTVRPGVTGLAQVSGRNTVNWTMRLEYDVKYVEQRSLLVDMQILYRTANRVAHGTGVVPDPESAMRNLDVERATRDLQW